MIVERYLLREAAYTFLAVSLLLILIYLSGTFIRVLAEAAEGDYPTGIVMQLFAYKGVGNLVFILPLSLFLGVLLALGRLYKDSEITALVACGVGPQRFYSSIAALSFAVALLSGLLAFYFAPWSEEQAQQLLDQVQASTDIEGVEPGRFNQSSTGNLLFYVEALDRDAGTLSNVFAYGTGGEGRPHLLSSDRGRQTIREQGGDRYLVFEDGYRYEGRPGEPDYRITEFEEHGVLIREREVVASRRPRHARSTLDLMGSDDRGDVAELHWRIAVPVSAILLGILAVPLSKTSPRQGRYGKLFAAIVIYIIYNNLLTVARASLSKGEYDTALGLWWVHAMVAAAAGFLIWRQHRMPAARRAGKAPA